MLFCFELMYKSHNLSTEGSHFESVFCGSSTQQQQHLRFICTAINVTALQKHKVITKKDTIKNNNSTETINKETVIKPSSTNQYRAISTGAALTAGRYQLGLQ